MALIGGYAAGGATYDPTTYKSVLSGDLGVANDTADNSNKLLYIVPSDLYGSNDSIYISNLEFRDAYNSGFNDIWVNNYSISTYYGGAIYIQNSNVSINNSVFKNNNSYYGCAIFAQYSDLNLTNNEFIENSSDYGGALYLYIGHYNIKNNRFYKNFGSNIGAFYMYNGNNVEITNNTFDENKSLYYGDAWFIVSSDNIKIESNTVKNHIGSPLIMMMENSNNTTICNNIFANNIAADTGIYYYHSSILYNYYNTGKIYNNLFVNNKSIHVEHNTDNVFTYSNNTLYNNEYDSLFAQNINANYFINNFFHNDTTYAGNLNGFIDPMFAKTDSIFENGNYQLQFCSPLLNAGDTVGITSTTDFLGNARIIGTSIDLGPYEKTSDDVKANNAALATNKDNGVALLPICEDDEWTYYSPISNPDSVVMGIKWDTANAVAKAAATVMIQVDSANTLVTNGNDKGMASLPRYWNIDIDTNALVAPVSVKFYYTSTEFDAMNIDLNNEGLDSLEAPVWFVMDETFVPGTHVAFDNINGGNFTAVTPTVDTINGIHSVQFDSLMAITSGGAFIQGSMKPSAIKGTQITNGINVHPNPAVNQINFAVKNSLIYGKQAQVLDMYGRVLASFEVKANNIVDISKYATGVYMIKIEDASIKFIKQ